MDPLAPFLNKSAKLIIMNVMYSAHMFFLGQEWPFLEAYIETDGSECQDSTNGPNINLPRFHW